MNRKFFKKIFRALIALTILVVGTLTVTYNSFYGSAIESSSSIFIDEETTYDEVTELCRQSIPSSLKQQAFNFYASHLKLSKRIKTGHYTIKEDMSVVSLVRMLVLGEQTPVKLVIGEARTLPQLAGKISKQIMADSVSILTVMYDKAEREAVGYKRDSLIAMFIPNSYQVYWNITPQQLLARMKKESDAFWSSREQGLANCGLSKYQAMTLASIVYEETKNKGEMPKIAGVYINRLRKRIPLQACPTVKYAMGDFSLTRILLKHLKYDSPFNTYRNAGLPPAPICIPSISAIDAVLNYQKSDYLYFCARPEFDGTHNFAKTLKEHNANSKRYNEALKRLQKKK